MEIEHLLDAIVPNIAATLEAIGIVMILIAVVRTLIALIKNGFDFSRDDLRITFAQGLAYGLEFKMAAEIIKTAIVHSLREFIVLAAVVILRVILALVIQWELSSQEEPKGKD